MVLLCAIAQGAAPKSVTNTIGMELIEILAGSSRWAARGEKDRQGNGLTSPHTPGLIGPTVTLHTSFVPLTRFARPYGHSAVEHDLGRLRLAQAELHGRMDFWSNGQRPQSQRSDGQRQKVVRLPLQASFEVGDECGLGLRRVRTLEAVARTLQR